MTIVVCLLGLAALVSLVGAIWLFIEGLGESDVMKEVSFMWSGGFFVVSVVLVSLIWFIIK